MENEKKIELEEKLKKLQKTYDQLSVFKMSMKKILREQIELTQAEIEKLK